jgi:hypothetical protein
MDSLRTSSSKNQLVTMVGVLALTSLISSTGMATPQQPLDIKRGFGAPGAMVFTVTSGSTYTTCLMDNNSHGSSNMYIRASPSSPTILLDPRLGAITLHGGGTYHISSSAMLEAFTSAGVSPGTTKVMIVRQVFCDNGPGFLATIGPQNSWSVTCTAGGCTTTSGAIAVTLP